MKILVGLGNPGSQYDNTRHNIGFMAVDRITQALNAPNWRSKFQAYITEALVANTKVIFLKPQTFMNLSGQSVGEVCHFYKIPPQDVIVFHDELDLAPGKVRVKFSGGHAGHNGLRSMHQHIGADYQRVRMGIGHPGDKNLVTHYVLGKFAKADEDWVEPLLDNMAKHIADLIKGNSNDFASRIQVAEKTKSPPTTK